MKILQTAGLAVLILGMVVLSVQASAGQEVILTGGPNGIPLPQGKELSDTLKQAIIDGDPDLLTVEEVSKMKSRVDVLGELALLIGSPARAVAACVASPQSRIAGCLKALADKAA